MFVAIAALVFVWGAYKGLRFLFRKWCPASLATNAILLSLLREMEARQ